MAKKAKKIKPHKSVKARGKSKRQEKILCPHCRKFHSKSEHDSHGVGSFERFH